MPRWLCQCCPPSEFLSASSPPPSVFSLCPSPSLPSYRLSLFFSLSALPRHPFLFTPSVLLPAASGSLLLFLSFLNFCYFSLFVAVSSVFCYLHPSFSIAFLMPYDGFVCQLASANPWPQYTTIFPSPVSALQTSLVHLHYTHYTIAHSESLLIFPCLPYQTFLRSFLSLRISLTEPLSCLISTVALNSLQIRVTEQNRKTAWSDIFYY